MLPIPVVLARCAGYDAPGLPQFVGEILEAAGYRPKAGDAVLVKPNLLRADPTGPTCTHPAVVAAACAYLLDHGCRVTVGDSPGFGTAPGVAAANGLTAALAGLCASRGAVPILVRSLDSPVYRSCGTGPRIALSRYALEADHILTLPKLKAHSQMRLTGAVKNCFGCVSGMRKAWLHAKHGDKSRDGYRQFPALLADIPELLPPVVCLMDGIIAMHVTGPSSGKPYAAGLLAASLSPVALDTAVFSLLGRSAEEVPLWAELQRRRAPGAFLQDIFLRGAAPELFDFRSFIVPAALAEESFNPLRLARSTVRRLWARLTG